MLAEGLLADCSTRIIYRQEPDQLAAAASLLGLTGVETQAVSALTKGRGLWKVAYHSFITQHILHPAERELFDTDARMAAKAREFTNTDAPIPVNRRVVAPADLHLRVTPACPRGSNPRE